MLEQQNSRIRCGKQCEKQFQTKNTRFIQTLIQTPFKHFNTIQTKKRIPF